MSKFDDARNEIERDPRVAKITIEFNQAESYGRFIQTAEIHFQNGKVVKTDSSAGKHIYGIRDALAATR